LVQRYISAENAVSFDVSAACAGFVFALDIADSYIKSGKAKNILVAGGDVVHRIADYHDRSNCILFGDGAGAVVVSACESEEKSGIISSYLKCDCDGQKPFSAYSQLYKPGEIFDKETKVFKGNAEKLQNQYIYQNGREVYQFVVRMLPQILEEVTTRAGIAIDDLDYIILHQANKRILEYVIEKYKLPPEKVPINIEKYGNMSSATVPVILHELNAAGKIKRGDLIALAGFGSGLAYGATVVKW
jgi:3-oxoacyl-[acyl-carrier-protein] synthase-3